MDMMRSELYFRILIFRLTAENDERTNQKTIIVILKNKSTAFFPLDRQQIISSILEASPCYLYKSNIKVGRHVYFHPNESPC